MRYDVEFGRGLTAEQVETQRNEGLTNIQANTVSKTVGRIVRDNLLTFFNLLNVVLAAIIMLVGSYKNLTFLLVVVVNTIIGIIQELRAKRTLDKLSLISSAKATVIRDGQGQKVNLEEIVLDDIMVLSAGDQICADAVVREGSLEVNESLLTGESDVVLKKPGDTLFSGSFAVSGRGWAQVEHVGRDNFAYKITEQAKKFKKHRSELRDSLDRILKVISILIVPLGVGLYVTQVFYAGVETDEAAVGTVAAVIGMIPEGLILLTSIALAVGVINLGRHNTLVHELFCIETLARVDVLCLDKTGTLTEGTMRVQEVIPLSGCPVDEALGNLVRALPDENATMLALRDYFPPSDSLTVRTLCPFSSERKYSGAAFEGAGSYLIGAYEFLFDEGDPGLVERVMQYTQKGVRVLVLAHSGQDLEDRQRPEGLTPCALILIHDVIREDAAQTLAFFAEEGVELMVISGDHPATVAHIAAQVGLKGADRFVDATTLKTPEELREAVTRYRIFGRVTPAQKKEIVVALKEAGHTVAMTGDGVNDVPALKEADCSIAMAAGSDAAKNCADLVLLDSRFSSMPYIVNEGRRVINNIQSSAALFLVKTIFSLVLTLLTICSGMAYPFMPLHLTVISAFAVGLPTFILSMEPNHERVQSGFFRRVLRHAASGALAVIVQIVLISAFTEVAGFSETVRTTMCAIATGIVSLYMIREVFPTSNRLRKLVFGGMFVLYFAAMMISRELLELVDLPYIPMMLVILLAVAAPRTIVWMQALFVRCERLVEKILERRKKMKSE